MRGKSAASTLPVEPSFSYERNERNLSWSKPSKDGDKAVLYSPKQESILNGRITLLKLVLCVLILGTLLYSLSIYDVAMAVTTASRERLIHTWKREADREDGRYISHSAIEWDEVFRVVDKLTDRNDYRGIGLLNFQKSETDQWKLLFPQAHQAVLNLERVPSDLTWEIIYPSWNVEELNTKCITFPKPQISGTPLIDFIAVKLPCNKSGDWSRDVARLHLQLAAAELAVNSGRSGKMHIFLLSECFPTPNLLTCRELVGRDGNAWLYQPNLDTLREKLRLPVGSCELSVPLETKEKWHSRNTNQEAFVTVLHSSNDYVCGAIVVAQSLKMVGTTRDLIILVDETISEYAREGLESAGWKIRTIERIKNPKAKRGSYNEWNYSKFRIWQLTEYKKIVFIDADLLVLRNMDVLFKLPEMAAAWDSNTWFNSGLMVVEPSNCTFKLLMDHVNEIESYNGGDQGYLNEIFTWWHRIPKRMNYMKFADSEETREMKTRLYGADPPVLYTIHYVGMKPWLCYRDYDCNWNLNRKYGNDIAHRAWWKIHDAMPKNLHKFCLLQSQQKEELELARKQAEQANYSDGHWKIQIHNSL